ncbi:MAG: DNA polymerase I [Epsilonproteobacteria bacterium]|nr:DNA polymerase I [Campylobacterota bacterium]NPA64517.1 DNA polymerase I [Campylobacterota bacterium]
MKTLTIVDTFGFFFRSFYALPPLKSKEGFPTGLLTGFLNFLNTLISEEGSDYILFALDSEGPSFRSSIDPNYKAQRPEPPQDLKVQLPVAIEWIEKMGLSALSKEGFEADDIIASVTKCAKEAGVRVKIVSHDKDLYQLIEDDKVVIYDPIKRVEIDEEGAYKKFGVPASKIQDYLALVGDSSDNIPGVRGIGPKTAVKLLERFESLEGIYRHIDEVEPPRVRKLLEDGKPNAFLSKKLVALRDDLFESCDLERFKTPSINPIIKIADDLIRYDITAILKKIKTAPLIQKESVEFEAVTLSKSEDLQKILSSIPEGALVSFDTETTSLDTKEARLVGFSFAFEPSRAYYVPVAHSYLGVGEQVDFQDAMEAIKKLFDYTVIGHNLKFDLSLLYCLGLPKQERFIDTMLLAWLVDPQSPVGLDSVAKRYLDHEMITYAQTVKRGEDFSAVPIDQATRYAAEDALITYRLYFRLLDRLKAQGAAHLIDEAKEVEYPFVNVLIGMERAGIKVDVEFFEKLKEKTAQKLEELTIQIYELAGGEFNINSTKQLGSILFERLALPPLRRTKTGYSTNEATLAALKEKHPIIPAILEYRELFKLKSTYIDPLLVLAKQEPDHRIYTTFLQTGTATGRLSSKNPNLQNIPIKTDVGRQIRYGFVAKEGYKLVGIDYSQIELRLLAHFSQDPALVEAFGQDRDIHMQTALRLFGQDAHKKRNIAKSINFGLIYGMGSRKLAQTLGISTKEAKEIIESYFTSFPSVREYLASIEEFAKREGYVETLLRRRRYFDFASASGAQLAAFLREATNTVFQGSAADLIKMAMLKIHRRIQEEGLEARMLLQIHDELIFEIQEPYVEELAQEFRRIMEQIYPLRVPIKCSVGIADRWGDLK